MRFFKALIDGLLNGLATIFSVVMFLLLLLLISFSFYFVFLTWCLRLHARVLRRPFCVGSGNSMCFSYWKNVRLKLGCESESNLCHAVSVVVERMYDWSICNAALSYLGQSFSCCWKNVRLKHYNSTSLTAPFSVSVVVERMYDWSSETNWLKINDFWQLVSGLFFENGRSAQKVPLFSKIWGDCLTVFDSCGNI